MSEFKEFRKIPVIIEAVQWLGHESNIEMVSRHDRWSDLKDFKSCKNCKKPREVHGWVDTLEGGHIVCPGDWIIKGIKGEHYPCKPEIFELTYQQVSSQPWQPATPEMLINDSRRAGKRYWWVNIMNRKVEYLNFKEVIKTRKSDVFVFYGTQRLVSLDLEGIKIQQAPAPPDREEE